MDQFIKAKDDPMNQIQSNNQLNMHLGGIDNKEKSIMNLNNDISDDPE